MPDCARQRLLAACAKGDHTLANSILGEADRRAPSLLAVRDDRGFGPVHCAAAYGRLQLVRCLLEDHAQDPHEAAGGASFATPVIIAARCGYAGIVEYLASTHAALSEDGAPATWKEWLHTLAAGDEATSGKPELAPAFGGQPEPVILEDLPMASQDGQGTVRHWLKSRYQPAACSNDSDVRNDVPMSDISKDAADDRGRGMRHRRGLSPLRVRTDSWNPNRNSKKCLDSEEDVQKRCSCLRSVIIYVQEVLGVMAIVEAMTLGGGAMLAS